MDYTKVVKLLLEYGAYINIVNNCGNTPLHLAVMGGYKEIVQLLLANAKELYKDKPEEFENYINMENKYKNTALKLAKSYIHNEIVELLERVMELNKKIKNDEKLLKNLSEKLTPDKKETLKIKITKRLEENKEKIKKLLKPEAEAQSSGSDISNYSKTFAGLKNIFQKPKTGTSSSRVSVGEQAGTSGTQNQKTRVTNQNNLYDVPADNSCLFWSVSTSYLLPVRNNNEEFRNRFIQLFGEENLKYLWNIQKLLQNCDLRNNRSLNQLWYQDQTANNLVISFFRHRVVDYIQSNLDTIPKRDGELTFRSLIQDNNEIDTNYLERMRQPSTWGGAPEIIAMSNLLNANISVGTDNPYQPVHQNANNNNIAISCVELEKGSGIHNHYNFALTPEEDQTNQPIVINDNQRNVPVVDITKRPDNLLPTKPKPEANAIKLAVDDHGKHHATLANNNEDDHANQGNNIAKAPEPTATPLQKYKYHFVDKKTEDDSLKNDENLEINLIKNNKDEIKQNAPAGNQPISTNMENLQTTTAEAINQYNALSKEEKLKKLNEINRYYQTLPENDKKAFKEKLTNTGLAALGGGRINSLWNKNDC